jgi:pyruvate, orthophosphate dikinase
VTSCWPRQRPPGLESAVQACAASTASIQFFHGVGLDYVSCSPFRVPIARLAAAYAQLEKPVGD